MRRSLCGGILALVLLAGSAATSVAQETGTPVFKAPYRAFESHEFGASFSDYEAVSGALEAFYTYGVRTRTTSGCGPASPTPRGRTIPGSCWVARSGPGSLEYSESFPLDGALTARAGRELSGAGTTSSSSRRHQPRPQVRSRRLQHHASLRTSTRCWSRSSAAVIRTWSSRSVLGVDIRFSERWAARVSGGIGDIEGVGISLAYIR